MNEPENVDTVLFLSPLRQLTDKRELLGMFK